MKITILGSGTAVPSLQRNSAGVLLQNDGHNWLFDFGYGNLKQLLHLGITYHDIDRIFFTHNHPDHMCDLVPFLFGSRYHNDPRTKDLSIIAGPGFREFYDGLMNAYKQWLLATNYGVEIIEQDEEVVEYDGLMVETRKVRHIEMSRGYRITDPKGFSVAISGDTDTCEGMIALGRNADLMILECAFPDDLKVGGHLTPRLCGQLAKEAACKTLCLTHFYPPCHLGDMRRICGEEYPGNIVLAEDLMVFDV